VILREDFVKGKYVYMLMGRESRGEDTEDS